MAARKPKKTVAKKAPREIPKPAAAAAPCPLYPKVPLANKTRRFYVTVTQRVELEVDQSLLDAVDDDWRKQFYARIRTPEDVVAHVGGNMARSGCRANSLDGFANLDPNAATVVREDWEAEAEEDRA